MTAPAGVLVRGEQAARSERPGARRRRRRVRAPREARRRRLTADVVDAFLASGRARGWAAKTESWYRYTLAFLVRAERELPETPEPVELVLAGLEELADSTRADVWSGLRIFYSWAAGRLDTADVMTAIARPLLRPQLMRTLTAREVEQLLWANHRLPREYALLLLLVDTGARIGEVHGLGWRDIEDDGAGGASVRLDGKTGQRRVPISVKTLAALEELRGRRELWVGEQGPLTLDGLQKAVQRCLRRAGLRGGPHLLRHTFGRLYVLAGGDVFSLQRIMGHRQISTTRKYVDLDLRDVAAQHAKFSPVAGLRAGRQLEMLEARGG